MHLGRHLKVESMVCPGAREGREICVCVFVGVGLERVFARMGWRSWSDCDTPW